MARLRLLIALALLFTIPAARADYPQPSNNYINDFAGVLTPSDATLLRDQLATLERETGIEGTVVTIRRIADYGTGAASIDQFATALFNRWGIGNQPKNNGFMILVAVTDRRCRIELGKGWSRSLDHQMSNIINSSMLPRFKRGDYNGGIVAAVNATIAILRDRDAQPSAPARTHNLPAEQPPQPRVQHQPLQPYHPPVQTHAPMNPLVGLLAFLAAIVGAIAIFTGIVVTLIRGGGPASPRGGFNDNDSSGGGGFHHDTTSSHSSHSSSSGGGFGGGSSSGGGASGGW